MKNLKPIFFSVFVLGTMLACSVISNFVSTPTPLPTNTPFPTSTPLPPPTLELNTVLFEDSEFTNSCSTESTADVDRFVENGQFHMRVNTLKYVGWTECTTTEFSDVVIEVDATLVAGPEVGSYGVIFRYGLDADEFYVFEVSGDGYYILGVDGADHTELDVITDWTESSAINQGLATNRIKVVAVGNSIQYYVNDQFLGEAQDERLTTGTFGFFVGSYDEGGVQVAFDNLKVSQP